MRGPCMTLFLAMMMMTTLASSSSQQGLKGGPKPESADRRCFLRRGGSTLNLFVRESLPAGAAIGRLDIEGENGKDIELFLDNEDHTYPDPPIKIEAPDLLRLTKPLDKAGRKGPTSFSAVVRCRRVSAQGEQNSSRPDLATSVKQTATVNYKILVNVRITGIEDHGRNDHSPAGEDHLGRDEHSPSREDLGLNDHSPARRADSSPTEGADRRCFLSRGGSTLSFFVKESLPVGGVIGRLDIVGENGRDVDLSLENTDPSIPVKIEAPNLLRLTRVLDKEGHKGPASINIVVQCRRRVLRDSKGLKDMEPSPSSSTTTSYRIPVTVHVTDVNDNVPQFVGAPYTINVSELTLVGTRVFDKIKAIDSDQPGPFSTVEYLVDASWVDFGDGFVPDATDESGGTAPYHDCLAFENPLEGSTLVLTKHLDYETVRNFRVKIVAKDQGAPVALQNETILTVNVLDADDQNPAFVHESYEAVLEPAPALDGAGHSVELQVRPQGLKAFDQDAGLASPLYYVFAARSESSSASKYFELNRDTGKVYVKSGTIPEDELLRPLTLIVKAVQHDNPDRYAVTTLTVSRGGVFGNGGVGDLKFLQKTYEVKVLENAPLNGAIITLLTNRPLDRRVRFHVDQDTLPDQEFSITEHGQVVLRKPLDFERAEGYSFRVVATDGAFNDSAVVNVDVLNINDWDPRFKYPQYEFFVAEEDVVQGKTIGVVEVFDGDKGDVVTLDLQGHHARMFALDEEHRLVLQDLKYLNGSDAHFVIVARDSGTPARRTSVPVVVRFPENLVNSEQHQLKQEAQKMALTFSLVTSSFILIVVSLVAYICRTKKRGKGSFGNGSSSLSSDGSVESGGVAQMIRTSNSSTCSSSSPRDYLVSVPIDRRGHHHHSPARGVPLNHEHLTPSTGPRGPPGSPSKKIPSILGSPPTAFNPLNPANQMGRSPPIRTNTSMSVLRSHKVCPEDGVATLKGGHINEIGLPSPGTRQQVSPQPPPAPPPPPSALVKGPQQVRGQVLVGPGPGRQVEDSNASSVVLRQTLRRAIIDESYRDMVRIEWPRNSIPRRIKKLSWEDNDGDGTEPEDLTNEDSDVRMALDRDITTLMDDTLQNRSRSTAVPFAAGSRSPPSNSTGALSLRSSASRIASDPLGATARPVYF